VPAAFKNEKEPFMATDIHDQAAVQTRLWDEIEKHQVGMLGLVGAGPHHFQPMTAFLDRATHQIWFFSYKDTALARAVAAPTPAMFTFQHDHALYACIGGSLEVQYDADRMERFWNSTVAAWYPAGKHDPRLTLLRLDAREAEVWIQEAGPARFAWQITKAKVTRHQPDLGGHASLNFH
jgi:general stress protein 26